MKRDHEKEKIGYYCGSYRKSLISKNIKIELNITKSYIYGIGLFEYENGISNLPANFNYIIQDVLNIGFTEINHQQAIRIVLKHNSNRNALNSDILILLGFDNYADISKQILDARDKKMEQLAEKKENSETSKINQEEFYENCFSYHISQKNRPVYFFAKEYVKCIALYIDELNCLNFLVIDGVDQRENNAIIPYSQLHYYEKAGAIHFATEINANCTSFGGSFSDGTFSKKAIVIGGLLLGPMGMAGGALLTHKPAQYTAPTINFDISSKISKIDDRSVILNYFSDKHNQLMDIELPEDIYNFLQTHIPDKRYNIVIEMEKNIALINAGDKFQKQIEDKKTNNLKNDSIDSVSLFKEKISKLKLMKETGLLSDEEFDQERKKILETL